MSLHRYDGGKFYPHSSDAEPESVGKGNGAGYNVNIAWNEVSNCVLIIHSNPWTTDYDREKTVVGFC